LSKTYDALIKAERLRASQDPAALARRVALAAEEGETLRADLHVWQEQLAALIKRVDAAATIDPAAIDDLGRQVTQLDEAHASRLALLQQQVAELQTDRGTLRDALRAMQSSLAEQLELAAVIEALHTQMASLVEAQARQNEFATSVSRAQGAADAAERRVAANEEALSSTLAPLRQQVDALQAESGTWREVDAAVQSARARQDETSAEIDALRTKLTRMMEAQRRQQQLLEDLLVAPAGSDDARLTTADSEESANLASLRRQVVALQVDRLNLDAFLEARFELLCDILDTELQAKIDELRGSVRGPVEWKGFVRKILPEALLQRVGLRKKA